MTTAIEYALMAGASYISNRDPKNQFPTPKNWYQVSYAPPEPSKQYGTDHGFTQAATRSIGATYKNRGQILPFAIPAVQPTVPRWQLWSTQKTVTQACLNFRFGRVPDVHHDLAD